MSSGLRPRPCIKEAEKIRNGMTLMYLNLTFVKHVTDEETLHRLGRTWYRRARRVIVRPPISDVTLSLAEFECGTD